MSYHVVDPDGLEPAADHPCDRRSIDETVGLATLAATRYDIAPGEQLPRVYHAHEHREELFAVLEGRLHVETPEREYAVAAGEVFVVEPGSPHRPFNPGDADGPVRVLGVGAPRTDPAVPYEPEEAADR